MEVLFGGNVIKPHACMSVTLEWYGGSGFGCTRGSIAGTVLIIVNSRMPLLERKP